MTDLKSYTAGELADLKAKAKDVITGRVYNYNEANSETILRLIAMIERQAAAELRQHWGAFTVADLVPAGFIERMEAAGFAELVPVTKEALEEPFAAELGIEPGGMMWQLTQLGCEALATTGQANG